MEADESDRSMLSLDVEIAVLTNVELDHHATFGSLARAARGVSRVPRAGARRRSSCGTGPSCSRAGAAPSEVEVGALRRARAAPASAVGSRFGWRGARGRADGARARTTRSTPPPRWRPRGSPGPTCGARSRGWRASAAPAGAFSRWGSPGGALLYDDYAHHPTEVAATLRAARTLAHGAWWRCSSRTCTRARSCSPREFGRALALADVVVVLDVYPARERAAGAPGVSGLLIAQAAADAAAGRPVYWLPTFADAEPVLARAAGRGDLCVVMGAGDVDALGRRLVEARR